MMISKRQNEIVIRKTLHQGPAVVVKNTGKVVFEHNPSYDEFRILSTSIRTIKKKYLPDLPDCFVELTINDCQDLLELAEKKK